GIGTYTNKFAITSVPSADDRTGYYSDLYLVNTYTGEKQLITRHYPPRGGGKYFSPEEKYFIWFERKNHHWYSFTTADGAIRNLTRGLSSPGFMDRDDGYDPVGIAGFMEGDNSVLIYDRFDIWKIDPSGKKPAVNLTNFYGVKHHLILRLLLFKSENRELIQTKRDLLLSAFSAADKSNGFYRWSASKAHDPQELDRGNYSYDPWGGAYGGLTALAAIRKAEQADVYVLQKGSTGKFPNIFITRDFKSCKQQTFFEPEKAFNWYHSQPIAWKQPSGRPAEGLLFTPENLDTSRKYPLIVYYYQGDNTGALNSYLTPELDHANINIPYMVSNGYAVFMPDIYNSQTGNPGRDALDVVNSGVDELAKFDWIDTAKVGLQGHSYGAFETNFIVSHSNRYKAAVSGEGVSNVIPMEYSFTRPNEFGGMKFYEKGQGGINATLWENRAAYLDNSAILRADQVTTPLFLMANKGDDVVLSGTQGIPWFNALSRLNKKVWLVDYQKEGHSVHDLPNLLDYSTRVKQFFDYYLKGEPAPKWMTQNSQSLEPDPGVTP
ncbi:MAG: prolyl oligopeptidase family serine peptidase, partial [Mucilaginibacter sp.]|uniref:S9 family peptidase n=1 Tax=Mucilaginibacter sp. TaxID=1882438 RepID=UPI0031A10D4F